MLIRRLWICLITGALAVMCVLECGLTAICLRNLIVLGALVYLSVNDLQYYLIPDSCLLLTVFVWFAAIPLAWESYGGMAGILTSILFAIFFGGAILAFSLLMDYVLKKETMGGGDIKLFAVSGLYLGAAGALFAMFLACIFGLCFAFLQRNKGTVLPFGPSIAVALWIMLLYGEPVIDWYMRFI